MSALLAQALQEYELVANEIEAKSIQVDIGHNPDEELVNAPTPNAFNVLNHIDLLSKKGIEEAGIEDDIKTSLGERIQMPVQIQTLNCNEQGELHSPKFPGRTLKEIYARAILSGDSIYAARAKYDVQYIRNVEEIIRNSGDEQATWLRFSPTTGNMSKESHIELGVQIGQDEYRIYTITIPFKKDQTLEEAFYEFRQLASTFNPKFTQAENEFDMLPHAIDPKKLARLNPNLYKDIQGENGISADYLLKKIDTILGQITGIAHFDGRPYDLQKNEQATYDLYHIFVNSEKHKELSHAYIDACQSGDPYATQEAFNVLVNHFDSVFNHLDLLDDSTYETLEELERKIRDALNYVEYNTSAPKKVAGGCGSAGQISGRKMDRIKDTMRKLNMPIYPNATDLTQCPCCMQVYLIDEQDSTTWILKCETPNCPDPYKISCGYRDVAEAFVDAMLEEASDDAYKNPNNGNSKNRITPDYIRETQITVVQEFVLPSIQARNVSNNLQIDSNLSVDEVDDGHNNAESSREQIELAA